MAEFEFEIGPDGRPVMDKEVPCEGCGAMVRLGGSSEDVATAFASPLVRVLCGKCWDGVSDSGGTGA